MSVSRRAGPAARGAGDVDPVLGRRQRGAPLGRVVGDVGQQDRELVLGHRDDPAALAVDDRDRAAPVALAREQPVAQAVVDRRVALALAIQPGHDALERLAVGQAVEVGVRVHERAVARVGLGLDVLAAGDDLADGQAELARELVVARVVSGDGHDRAGPVLHEHVVGHVHGQALAVDRVDDVAAQEHPGLLALGVAAVLAALGQHVVDVLVDRLLLLGALDEPEDVGVLGCHDEERRAEERVRSRGEDRVVDAQLLVAEGDLRALGAPDPVALHRLDVRGPLDGVEVVEQAVGVVGDAEEPLLELADLDEVAAALAAPVDDLLVGQDRLVVGAPLDGGLGAIGQAALEELEEDPLRPAVVARLVGPELARPVDRDPPLAELALEGGDRRVRGLARVLAGADRVVLGRQPEGVVAHGMQHAHPVTAAEVGDGVADRVVLQVPDVRLAAGVGQHLEHVGLLAPVGLVGHLPGVLVVPDALPARLDLTRVIAVGLGHVEAPRIGRGRRRPPSRRGVTMAAAPAWGYSSAGRAPAWHAGGRRFEPG